MMVEPYVDPELRPALEAIPTFDLTAEVLPVARDFMANMVEPAENYADTNIEISEYHLPGPNGAPDVRVVVYRPLTGKDRYPVFINMHGGGYLMGSPEFGGRVNAETAAEAKCVVVSVDYRVAPEHPAPAAVDDCYAVLKWVNESAEKEGFDRDRVAVGGDSAGGGLAAALAILARDRGDYRICFQLLIYPMLDDRTTLRTDLSPHRGQYVFNNRSNLYAWTQYLGAPPGGSDVSPYKAPARLHNFGGLPPAYVGVGDLDLFFEEDMDYARSLSAAGVPCELHVFAGAFHSFDRNPNASIAKRASAEFKAVLARALSSPQA